MGQEERSKEGCYAQTPWRCKSNQAWHQFQTTFSFQIEKVDRGGKLVEIVKHCAFGVPPIIIGHHLDKVMESDFEKQICVTLCQGGGGGLAREAVQPQMVHWGNCMVNWLWTLHIYTMDTMLIKVQQQCRHFDNVLCDDNWGGQSTTSLETSKLHQKGNGGSGGELLVLILVGVMIHHHI